MDMAQQRQGSVKKLSGQEGHAAWLCELQGSVEERIMEMVQQRKEGARSQEPSTSRGLTWADLGQPSGSDRNQVCLPRPTPWLTHQ